MQLKYGELLPNFVNLCYLYTLSHFGVNVKCQLAPLTRPYTAGSAIPLTTVRALAFGSGAVHTKQLECKMGEDEPSADQALAAKQCADALVGRCRLTPGFHS